MTFCFVLAIITLMLIDVSVFLFGGLIFLFLFWKRLQDDYSSEIIFKSAFLILFGVIVFWLVSVRFIPEWFLWIQFFGGLVGLLSVVFQLKVRFYETLEAMVLAFLPLIALTFIKDSIVNSSPISFFVFLAMLVVIFIYYFLDLHYKDFGWYKSGKIGFSGLVTLGIIFLARSLVALTQVHVLSFVQGEVWISAAAAFICFLAVFNLGRS